MRYKFKGKISTLTKNYRSDYQYATILSTSISSFVNVSFALFNCLFGFIYSSVWHISIFVYYALLTGIKMHLLVSIKRHRPQKKVYVRTHIFLLLMNLSMITPMSVMFVGKRQFNAGLIPAIAIAAYTTYRITMAIIHLKRARKTSPLLLKAIRTVNLVDALVAIMSLQNTMIMANGGMSQDMQTLCSWSNLGIFSLMLLISIHSFAILKKSNENNTNNPQ